MGSLEGTPAAKAALAPTPTFTLPRAPPPHLQARGKTQHDSSLSRRPRDPAGYLVDAELALAHGLTDHAFPYAGLELDGDRLTTMLRWLELQSSAFPKGAVGVRVARSRALLYPSALGKKSS